MRNKAPWLSPSAHRKNLRERAGNRAASVPPSLAAIPDPRLPVAAPSQDLAPHRPWVDAVALAVPLPPPAATPNRLPAAPPPLRPAVRRPPHLQPAVPLLLRLRRVPVSRWRHPRVAAIADLVPPRPPDGPPWADQPQGPHAVNRWQRRQAAVLADLLAQPHRRRARPWVAE